MSGRGKVVCVTGASGYIASWLVKMLLERDYTVNATVRSLSLCSHPSVSLFFSFSCVSCYVDSHRKGCFIYLDLV